ncbi:MAG TPA: hypothetical protein VHO67_04205 [Polyangia bacterium]|nr:hypothetical protein [Polyangia bacterium]
MHKKLSLFLVTALATTALTARANAKTTVDLEKGQGANVGTSFNATADITCPDGSAGNVFALGFISGSESIQKGTGSPRTMTDGVFVEVDEYFNSCTNVFASGTGGIPNGFLPPNKNLISARLIGSTSFQDFNSGLTIPVSMNLKISGSGPLTASKDNTVSHGSGPFTVTVSHTASSSREGTVTGTLSIGGVELDATFSGTTMFSNSFTTITVEKN